VIALKCIAAAMVILNGQHIPCAGLVSYLPREREIHIGPVRVIGARLTYQPGRIVISGVPIVHRSSFE